ncbi:carnitine O-palmitoyltransferase 2, mitochondrial [Bacillus rossius redtenbacheri]|uniref:carnitine O-palmitoyltransferase 2, mitochondrial n=1 Tax=Bacillus rossius redtenbacheri TaxID=93214 RepID=UPI002FDDEA87
MYSSQVVFKFRKLKSSFSVIHSCRWKSTQKNDDYQFIQRSKVPTMHFQKSLPRLPIPKLEDTCKRYLAAQMPLLKENEFKQTKQYVTRFCEVEGKSLQEQLKDWDAKNKHTSYICESWFDMYLRDRAPLPINYNPAIIFVNESRPEYNTQLIRATNMLISSLRFMKSLQAGILKPEVFHLNPKKSDTPLFYTVTRMLPPSVSWYGAYLFNAYPLDMSQYTGLFNATRIPEIGKDRIFRSSTGSHILVMKKGNLYTVSVLDKNGNILPPSDLLASMKYIIDDTSPAAEYPIGILTTEQRDTWAQVRKHLADTGNSENLSMIDSSIFCLILDDLTIGENIHLMLQNFLHGDGTNRWFDKTFSLCVAGDGTSAVNFEHSWGDGVAVLRYIQDIHKDSTANPRVHTGTQTSGGDPANLVRRLQFSLDETSKRAILDARKKYRATCDSLRIDFVKYEEYDRRICKQNQVSPDSIMQLGFQAAFHRLHGKYVSTYESCSTAAFRHGRTETIRPCTSATTEFCDALNSADKPSNATLKAMLKKCSQVHATLTKEAAMGQGFDRHLFALRILAERNGGQLPALYTDPAFKAINYNVLSTSTLSSKAVMAGNFGPVVKDGFGVAYTILDDMLGAVATSYLPHQDSRAFIDSLKVSFQQIFDILNAKV